MHTGRLQGRQRVYVPVTSKPATKTSLVAGLLEAQAGCRVEGRVLRVRVRRKAVLEGVGVG